ncbi:MAG: PBP1A family penicillin-binding protein [Candidatus Kapabacteria bacterium]|nr:PBP1A family penicillin-binding protein [Ignavibacteriota bacterium]MCW5884007.1 PBP1A family penicillin-binding protein [Candidatus Kapabacteria bacterium]
MKPIHLLILLCILTILITLGIALYTNNIVSYGMPGLEQLENPQTNLATRIYSSDGKLLDHFFNERRVNLTYDSIPDNFIKALVATEDRKFWTHWGVHTGRVINAAIKNVLGDKEGASTLTMQLSRNLFLSHAVSWDRKIREAFLSLQIEKTYTKKEILEMYSNTVYFGSSAYGIQVASQVYFDKDPSELILPECALLVGLLKAPESYNPFKKPEKAISRRNLVLKLMYDQEYITAGQYTEAIKSPLTVFKQEKGADKKKRRFMGELIAPHYVEMIRQDISRDNSMLDYNLYRDGLIIHTTLDSRIQRHANEAVAEHLKELQQLFDKKWNWSRQKTLLDDLLKKAITGRADYRAADKEGKKSLDQQLRADKKFIDSVKNAAITIQVGLVVIDPTNGSLLAMVGASPKFMQEHRESKYSLNHAFQIKRQPGSAFKPFVYASALQKGMTPESMIECGPFSYLLQTGEVWEPKGTGNCETGEKTSLLNALRISINTVSARLITEVTNPRDVVNLSRKMGIQSVLAGVPALSLGAGGDLDPLELTSAYGTFANNGIYVPPYYISTIYDKHGTLIREKRKFVNMTEAMQPEIAAQMIFMMQRVVDAGTASRAIRSRFKDIQAAGKTGTTNDAADAWFVGFTPQLVCGVWLGFDDKRVTFDVLGSDGYGGRSAAPIWGILMDKIYSDMTLPYKQRMFSYTKKDDSLTWNAVPYPVTEMQLNSDPQLRQKIEDTVPRILPKEIILPPLPLR